MSHKENALIKALAEIARMPIPRGPADQSPLSESDRLLQRIKDHADSAVSAYFADNNRLR